MSNEVFLPYETEQSLLLGERILFVVSSLLNALALFCLIRETPSHQWEIRSHLIFIQVTVIATDVYFCVLFEPFPVLQVFAGYCAGLLCRFLQPTVVVGVYAAIVGAMGASIFLATVHRHQRIIMRGQWILRPAARTALKWILVVCFCGPCILFALLPFDRTESDRLIEKSFPDVTWIRERGGYFMLERRLLPCTFITIVMALLVFVMAAFVVLFGHMFVFLHRESVKSAKLKRTIRISLVRLFIQLGVPILFILIPLMLLMSEILFEKLSFDFCMIATCVIAFHPITHNLILLLIVSEYRAYLAKRFCFCLSGRNCSRCVESVQVSDSAHINAH